ncbi:hypothetical protein [Streptomyces odonnellii]|uniref:hypothetical protein n=1 Tax=Streptomyces odonnellii TaxID=1417980 RepID=UPI000A97A6EF|nr:hypothetical protein [Streptomyces odonnellii]
MDSPDAATVFEAAREFAGTEYLVALHQGSALPAERRGALADRLAAFTGLPAGDIAG